MFNIITLWLKCQGFVVKQAFPCSAKQNTKTENFSFPFKRRGRKLNKKEEKFYVLLAVGSGNAGLIATLWASFL